MQRAPETIFGAHPWGAVLPLGRCAPGARGPLRSALLRSGLRRPYGPPRRASARVAPPPSPRGRLRLSGARPCGAGVSVLKVAPWVTWTRLQTRQLTPSATLYGYRGLVRSLRSLWWPAGH